MRRSISRAKAGQAVILLLALLVALAAIVVWIAVSNSLTLRRLRLRDGGDAAALAAARWQAAGLNLVGELNLIQAYMLADNADNAAAAEALHELRQRIQLATPFLALVSASETAAANDLPEIPEAAEVVREIADEALFQDFYPGAEADFRAMAQAATLRPLHAAPASPGMGPDGGNLLVNQDFYEAVLGDDWCWFWFNAYSFLQHYGGHTHFGPVPPLATEPFLGLRLTTLETSLNDLIGAGAPIDAQLVELGHPTLQPPADNGTAAALERTQVVRWSAYDSGSWGPWEAMHAGELPIDGTLKEEYDYFGASAAISVAEEGYEWLAVAKAFGDVGGGNPTAAGLVLGGFDDVRLIPVDAGDVGITAFNPTWIRHLRRHIQSYASTGLTFDNCRYCEALRKFDNRAWRTQVIAWLAQNGHTCRRPTPDGDGSGGGARFGH